MDMNQFKEKFEAEETYRTEVLAAIAGEIKKSGLNGPLVATPSTDGGLQTFVYDPQTADIGSQLSATDAAIAALKKAGVTNLDGMTQFDPDIDPYAWNVVYKDGGWVVNGMVEDGLGM